eukprot:COSAG06_NODE_5027_length_3781_cov_1.708582_1_plen_124_part_00
MLAWRAAVTGRQGTDGTGFELGGRRIFHHVFANARLVQQKNGYLMCHVSFAIVQSLSWLITARDLKLRFEAQQNCSPTFVVDVALVVVFSAGCWRMPTAARARQTSLLVSQKGCIAAGSTAHG